MTVIAGCDGSVKVKVSSTQTYLAEVKEWQLQVQREQLDVSVLHDTSADAGWKKTFPGFKSWSGSLTCHWAVGDTTDPQYILQDLVLGITNTTSAAVEVELYTDDLTAKPNKKGYRGTIYVTNFSTRVGTSGIIELSISFQGTGKLYTTLLSGNA